MAPAVKMWRKRFLIPLWLVQIIVLGIYFVLACLGLALYGLYNDSDYNYSSEIDNAM
jgi:hypothetical protein